MASKYISKAIAILLAFIAVGMSLCHGQQPAEQGMVAYWSFDGNLNDQAGAVKDNLTSVGTDARFVTADQVPVTSGKAIALGVEHGDSTYLTTPISDDLKLGSNYTIEMWVHPTQLGVWNRLVLNWGAPAKNAYHVAIHNGMASLYHGQSDDKHLFAEGGSVIAGQWHHIAAVASRNESDPANSQLKVYLNGKCTATRTFDGTIGQYTDLVTIGASNGNKFYGYLDDVAIWSRVLGADEIRAHYNKRGKMIERMKQKRRAKLWAKLDMKGVEEVIFSERGPGLDYHIGGKGVPSHYYANFGYACVDPNFWFHCKDGSRLIKLNVKTGEQTIVLEDVKGAIRDPQVHYDGQKILFSYRKNGGHNYNLYEISVDGTNLKQITSGPWDDIEPCYLPDGGIVFSSSRCKRYIACWVAPTAILYRCDGDGGNLRILSSNTVSENTPCVLPDGRILYTRWEYVNRDPVVYHHLWTINPDGSNQQIYFGNMNPRGVFIDAKPIYGTDRVVFINSPGHGRPEHAGSIATVTDNLGPDNRSAVKTILQGKNLRDPYPISKDTFLAAQGNKILYIERDGKVSTLFNSSMMVHEPSPVRKRNRERVAPSRIDLTKDTATLILSDVYNGRNMSGIKRGAIKKLLVMEDLPKPVNFHGGGSQPIGHGVTTTLKRILGTVEVEADGSAYFEVPPLRSIYFAALDENDLSIKQMRSFVTLQPGETLSCVGCHEQRTKAPLDKGQSKLLALSRAPDKIQPYKDVPDIIDFPRDVQPVLDKHCIKCHNHKKRKGGLVLQGDRGPVFSHSFYSLILHWQVKDTRGNPINRSGRQLGNDNPYACFSSASPLMKKIDGSHHDVKLDEHDTRIIRLWLDTCTQYAGTYAAYGTGQVGGCWGWNEPVRVMDTDWPSTEPAKDAIKRRCGLCHGRELPKHITDTTVPLSHGDMLSWERPMSRFSRHRVFNLTSPDKSLVLLSPLSKKAGGYATGEPVEKKVIENKRVKPKPVKHPVIFESTDDGDYQKILTHVTEAKDKLNEIKRFDMPGFKPNEHYIREMKRYGVLDASFDLANAPIDVYAVEQDYFKQFWHQPKDKTEK